MKRAHQSVAFLIAVLLCFVSLLFRAAGFAADENKEDVVGGFARLQRSMTMQQVRNRLGAPKHIVRQILYHRYLEQWIYQE
ncbi:MAG: hypothetical protein ACRELF_16750, partial [Gemmataceae bacterium]